MTTKELIELLQQLPQDAEFHFGAYNGEIPLDASDFIVYSESKPLKIVIPDYEWGSNGPYVRLDEHLKTEV